MQAATPPPSYAEAQARADRDTRTLGQELLRHARRHPRRVAVIDARGEIGRLRLAAVALALFPLFGLGEDEQNVGIVLPPGVGGSLVNVALALAGRTAVNLNHTTGEAQLARMCALAGVRTIISSKLYLRRIDQPVLPGRVILAEDLIPRLGKLAVLRQMARVLLLPPSRVDRARPEQVAMIIFSSGTTGDPKGVELTHRAILANTDAVMPHMGLVPGVDSITNPLPLFHAFGLLPGLWLALVHGSLVAAQADPRDGKALGELVARARTTFLISTPTFVRGYMRRIEPEQIQSLRFVVVGAERCPEELKTAFKERYGIGLLEGYGATEVGPAVAINTPTDSRDGTVGRPLPGVELLTMHPETHEILPPGTPGLIVVRTPARLRGYLDRPDLTERVLIHGGYNTGDMGRIDADGYLTITGRLARFAKIGGEMVPLDNVEDALARWVQARHGEAYEVAIGAAASPRRGEKLIVMHTGVPDPPEAMIEGAFGDLPQIFKPKPADFFAVDAIPLLGTGKRDLAAIKHLAERLAADAEPVGAAVSGA